MRYISRLTRSTSHAVLALSPRHAGVVSSIRNSPHRFVLFCAREQVYAERLT
jgi:hypothetical protein